MTKSIEIHIKITLLKNEKSVNWQSWSQGQQSLRKKMKNMRIDLDNFPKKARWLYFLDNKSDLGSYSYIKFIISEFFIKNVWFRHNGRNEVFHASKEKIDDCSNSFELLQMMIIMKCNLDNFNDKYDCLRYIHKNMIKTYFSPSYISYNNDGYKLIKTLMIMYKTLKFNMCEFWSSRKWNEVILTSVI